MYDRDLIASIKQIGQLRKKPNYYQSLVDLFALEVSRSFDSLSDQVQNALGSPPAEQIEDSWRILHKLKGSAASIGAVAVANSCGQLMNRWRSGDAEQLSSAAAEVSALESQCQQAISEMRSF